MSKHSRVQVRRKDQKAGMKAGDQSQRHEQNKLLAGQNKCVKVALKRDYIYVDTSAFSFQ